MGQPNSHAVRQLANVTRGEASPQKSHEHQRGTVTAICEGLLVRAGTNEWIWADIKNSSGEGLQERSFQKGGCESPLECTLTLSLPHTVL